jgi:Flp pilus assembly protein TadG
MIAVDWFYTVYALRSWTKNEDGTALIEAAMLLPSMLTLLMGVFDLGNGITLSQKTITSSQIAADLVSRNRTMDTAGINDIIEGAKLAFEPYSLSGFGIDVVSVQFDAAQQPVILWRETVDMSPNDDAVQSVSGLAPSGEGMIIVTVRYSYLPLFSHFFLGGFDLEEVAFARGRRTPTVTWAG